MTFGLNALWLELCANPYLQVGSFLMLVHAFWPFLIPMREFPWSQTTHFWEGPLTSKVCFLFEGVVHEEGPPAEIFGDPKEERTRAFLKRIIEAGRL